MTASVILPTYNERETIVALINEVLAAVPDVVVVDDDSPDMTWSIVEQTFAGDSRVRVVRRIGRRRLPSALAEGTNQAKGEAAVWLDADGSMPAAAIPALLAGLGEAGRRDQDRPGHRSFLQAGSRLCHLERPAQAWLIPARRVNR
jgi:dolichol-phosphate mannosyltransferase